MIDFSLYCGCFRAACRRATLALTMLLVAAISAIAAEQGYSFDRTPGRLPKTVIPIHYAIELEPDLDNLTLAGSELIDIELREATDRLVLNAVDLTFDEARIHDAAQSARIGFDRAAETATLVFPQMLPAGPHKLRITFTAKINKFGRGIFLVEYPTERGPRRMISTHLEPADARRVFPCWDEPAFKASMALTVTIPRSFLAVGNMPITREEPVTPTLKQVVFAATPKMSTYLFVLTAGELERLSAVADGVTIGVVTAAGRRDQGSFALESAANLLRYFNAYFGVRYPLPKLDLIAVPGGFRGAMENWGAITFFESRLLFDPATRAPSARRGIFVLLAHEMAHQWFGNLVTMAWWDNLWLNEGFASWMQAKAAEHFFPQWRTWLNSNAQKQSAMNMDARRTSHPIQQPVATESEAMAAFDAITYSKGQALIRMLESYLGEEAFRAGIRNYMAGHAYGSTTTADLWQALEKASGKPVGAIAGAFTQQAGVPLIIAQSTCEADEQRIRMRQERLTIRDPAATPQRWQVPVALGPLRAVQMSETVLVADGEAEFPAGRCGEPVKLNVGDVGYYRVEYDETSRAALRKSFALMAAADRLNLLADSWALVEAGRSEPQSYFELIEEIGGDEDRAVWAQVVRSIGRLNRVARGRAERPALQAYARTKLRPLFERLGWDAAAREDDESALLRTLLIRALGELNDEEIIAEAKSRFATFQRDRASLRPALREVVVHLAGQNADRATHEALLALARNTTNTAERVRYYSAAASARDPVLAREMLALALTDELPSTLRGAVINAVAGAGEQPELAWEFVQKNFAALAARQGPSFRDAFVANLMSSFSDTERADELAAFAAAHATAGGKIIAARAREAILIDAEFKARVVPALDDWLQRRTGRD
jgi:aminopeptidase N